MSAYATRLSRRGRAVKGKKKGGVGGIVLLLVLIIIFTLSVYWSMDEIMIYYYLLIRDENLREFKDEFVEERSTAVFVEGIPETVLEDGEGSEEGTATNVSSTGKSDCDTSGIGHFGPFLFWLEYETGLTDENAYDMVTFDDSLGGQAYGMQFDLFQGSLQEFLAWCVKQDPVKYAEFAPLVSMSTSSLYAYSDSDIMPRAWHNAYRSDPDGFAKAQRDYLQEWLIDPIVDRFEAAGIAMRSRADVCTGAVVSYAHQWGQGKVTPSLMSEAGITNADSDEEFLKKLYERRSWSGQYVQRWTTEKDTALELLKEEQELMKTCGTGGSANADNETSSGSGSSGANGTGIHDNKIDAFWPLGDLVVSSSGYGWRIHPIYGTQKFHAGEDIPADEGTPIYSALDGEVIYAGWVSGYGNYTVIKHDQEVFTAYGHQSVLGVSAGQKVKAGEEIGKVGNTGGSTGPHLHFEVYTPWAKDETNDRPLSNVIGFGGDSTVQDPMLCNFVNIK